MFLGNFVPIMHPSQHYNVINSSVTHTNLKNSHKASETHHNQHARELQQLDQSSTTTPAGDQTKYVQIPQKLVGFTKQQEHVLKAQILAFRRLKIIIQTGQGTIPDEILRAIGPPPLDLQAHQKLSFSKENMNPLKANDIALQKTMEQDNLGSIDKAPHDISTKSMVEGECANQQNSMKCDPYPTKGTIQPFQSTATDSEKAMISLPSSNSTVKDGFSKIKYHGPIFDFPSFMRRHESSGSKSVNHTNFVLSNDIDELIYEESTKVLAKKREANLSKH